MDMEKMGADISKSALIIVDMQNDFVHPDGGLAHRAREAPEARIDIPFLMGTIPYVKRLAQVSTPERKCIDAPEQRCIDDERREVATGSRFDRMAQRCRRRRPLPCCSGHCL